MPQKPSLRKVQVQVIPADPDLEGEFYVTLEMSELECQLKGKKFADTARKAIDIVLKNGKIFVKSDGQDEVEPGDSHHFNGVFLTPYEFTVTSIRRLVDSAGKTLTNFGNDTKISSLTANNSTSCPNIYDF